MPKARGGPEMTPREQTEIVEMLSHADPSVGWCVMIGSDAPYFGSFMDPDVADKLFADPDAITAGLVQPAGQAQVADGGYVVRGRWAFGSGCTHADVLVGGVLVMEGDAPPRRRRPAVRLADRRGARGVVRDPRHVAHHRARGQREQ